MTGSRSAAHFQQLYDANPDPWAFKTSAYEQAKYRRTLQVLDGQRFQAGLEVGCSIGILTHMLAPRCATLLGVDIVEDPLQAARARCADLAHVRFDRMQVPAKWPDQRFDLIVFSEVLYFLAPADIERCAARVLSSLLPRSTVLLVNWLGQSDDPTTGDDAAGHFIAAATGAPGIALGIARQERHEGYRLDVLTSVG